MNMGETVLQLSDLGYSVKGRTILDGVDLTVNAGETAVILGPSGVGKSTLLKNITFLKRPDRGTVSLDGHSVTAPNVSSADVLRLRKAIATVFQTYPLFNHRTVLENIVEPLLLVHGIDRHQAEQIAQSNLELFRLGDKGDAMPRELSGGEKQRVSIARALAAKPKVVLFDEPTSALDHELVGEVCQTVRTLADKGIANVVVTHDIDFARRLDAAVYELDQGVLHRLSGVDEFVESHS